MLKGEGDRRTPATTLSVLVPASDPTPGTAVDDFADRLEAALARGPRELCLDLAGVDRVSSTTVGLLLWARRRCASQGVAVVVRHASRRCREVLARTDLLRLTEREPTGCPRGTDVLGAQR